MTPHPDTHARRLARIQFAASAAIILLTCGTFAYIERSVPEAAQSPAVLIAVVMVGLSGLASLVLIPPLAGGPPEKGADDGGMPEREHLYMKTLMDNIPDRVYFKDRDSRFIMVSRSFIDSKNLDASIIGKTDFDVFAKEHAQQAFDGEQGIIRTGEPIVNHAEKLTMPDGTVTWGLSTKIPVRNQAGEIIGTLGVTKDITSLKDTETALAAARDAAVESSRIKSEFLANMSHEIRTPMNGVIGMTGLILDTELTATQREFAETIRNSADSLLTIINDILDFSKIEAGKLSFEKLDFDLVETVEGALDMFAERARFKGIELACEIPADVPAALRGDPGRLRQVITNLLGNGIKFTEKGEVIVRLSVEKDTPEDVVIKFSVKDTGVGIPTDVQNRLFQAFTQADNSTTRKYGGTGLGLAISKQLVSMMNGEIGVLSEAGKGSTFWFTARLDKQTGPPRPAPSIYFRDLFDLRVLVVDDNATNRQILRHQLYAWKMQKGSASDGFEALELLRAAAKEGRPYELALLDMQMPEMDGMTLAKSIKADPAIASTRLIILTSMGHMQSPEELKAAGVDAFLVKPVKQSRLFDCLISVLGRTAAEHVFAKPASESKPDATVVETVHVQKARILLAEDNIVNQKVALAQLRTLGFTADSAANGHDVIAALKQTPYDIILMDCQMPEMDGYEATRLIRQAEKGNDATWKSPVRIIAMTANAMSGDREKCLSAGMDDYLSKPVRRAELALAMARWQPPEDSA